MPNLEFLRSKSDNCMLGEDALVEELLDLDTRQWNRSLIYNSFNRQKALKVVSIPISLRPSRDKLCWHWEKDGFYSVRSAYHLMSNHRENLQPGPSSHRDERLWKAIWKAPIPNKIKNFIWRLVKNILPTRSNLQRKGIVLDTSCPFCHYEIETAEHLFMNCNMSKLVLFASPLGSHSPINVALNCWILEWLSCADKEGTQLFCTILWKIWFARNQIVFNGTATDPVNLAQTAVQFLQEFNVANVKGRPQQPSRRRTTEGPPPADCHHMFVDAGCFSNGTTGWGLILKNQDGRVVHSACKLEMVEVDPFLAEALGVRWALSVGVSLGIQRFNLSSDALNVVNCVNRRALVVSIDRH